MYRLVNGGSSSKSVGGVWLRGKHYSLSLILCRGAGESSSHTIFLIYYNNCYLFIYIYFIKPKIYELKTEASGSLSPQTLVVVAIQGNFELVHAYYDGKEHLKRKRKYISIRKII